MNHHLPKLENEGRNQAQSKVLYRPVEEDGMGLVELVNSFWNERVLILKIVGTFILIGLFVALFSPNEYTTEASLMPEMQQTQGRAGSLLQQYGGMLGINSSNLSGQSGAIPPQLYPNIVQSLPFQVELMNRPVRFSEYDTTATLYDFFTEINSPSLFGYVRGYTIGLPGKIINLFKSDEPEKPLMANVDKEEVLSLSKAQMEVVKILRERLSVSINQETGILTLSGEFPDPQATAEISRFAIELLKQYVKEYRTEKARQNLEFVRQQMESAKKRFEEAQQKLAEFRDSNVNLATAKAESREQELQSQYDLTFNLYSSLSQRVEQAKLDLQEETPVLSVIQPVSVPLDESSPRRVLIMIVFGLLSGVVSFGWVLGKIWWSQNAHIFK